MTDLAVRIRNASTSDLRALLEQLTEDVHVAEATLELAEGAYARAVSS